MTYLLDTNVAVALLRDRPASVRSAFRRVIAEGSAVAVSAVTIFELWYGVRRSERPVVNATRVRLFLSGGLERLPFDDEDAVVAGRLRAELAAAETPIGSYDLLIASQALKRSATLVTANVTECARVSGLQWEDWTAPPEPS